MLDFIRNPDGRIQRGRESLVVTAQQSNTPDPFEFPKEDQKSDKSTQYIDTQSTDIEPTLIGKRYCSYTEHREIAVYKVKNETGMGDEAYFGSVKIDGKYLKSTKEGVPNSDGEVDGDAVASYSFTYTYTQGEMFSATESIEFKGLDGAQSVTYKDKNKQ